MSEIQDTTGFDELLGNVNFDDIDISYSPMDSDNHNDETEALLGVAPALTQDAMGTNGLATLDGVCGSTRSGPDPCQGSSPSPPPIGRRLVSRR